MQLKFGVALLHLQQHAPRPHQIGETGGVALASLALPLYPELELSPGLFVAGVTKCLEEPIAEDLRLALLVTGKCPGILHELLELLDLVGHRHPCAGGEEQKDASAATYQR